MPNATVNPKISSEKTFKCSLVKTDDKSMVSFFELFNFNIRNTIFELMMEFVYVNHLRILKNYMKN